MSALKLQVLGNIGQDATVSEVNGRFCINFSVAHNKQFTDNDGVLRKITTWVNCGYWKDKREKTAIAQYLKAGTIVLVEGTPEVRQYKNKDGQMVASLQCNVTSINLAGSAQKSTDEPHVKQEKQPEPEFSGTAPENEDDLAF
ncbi:MAG: single-stranded DNA-binding protein [Bacteroidetes bacterium]|nr:single-stranded DNA-binding protein [Bacteroidota bacterium]